MTLSVLTAAVLLLTAAWVGAPLAKRAGPSQSEPLDERWNDLQEAKYAVYRSILDLEFDRKMGKVSDGDYAFLRGQHEADALKILEEMNQSERSVDVLEMEIAAARDRLRR